MTPDLPDIAPRDLAQRLAAGVPLTLLDVREPAERSLCALPAGPAVVDLHVPMRTVPARVEDLSAASADRPMVVYCHHGVRSRMVGEWLAARGLNGLLNLAGGIDAWAVEVDPRMTRY